MLVDLLERIEGRDFREVIEDRVCAPLGLPRVLGLARDDQDDIAHAVVMGDTDETRFLASLTDPDEIAAGVPGGGGIMTAASLALFYQGVLHNPGGLWDAAILEDVTTNIRCTFPDPLLDVPVNRTAGLVVAGDDGQHFARYAGFGFSNSPSSYGHAGAFMQIGWADPTTGISFAYCHNGLYDDMIPDAVHGIELADLAAQA